MINFPNAKINIGLNVVEKRDDGYHTIESIFYPVKYEDALEIVPAEEFNFSSNGRLIDCDANDNLCVKAYKLLKQDYNLPNVNISLFKNIPLGAGLGGGSADATFVLLMLNNIFKLNISDDKLEEYSLKIGSDCPFFVKNSPVFVTGRGEIFETIELSLKEKFLVLVTPNIHVSTKEAYSGIVPKKSDFDLRDIASLDISRWRDCIKNDFETTIFTLYPQIEQIKNMMYEQGAVYASMSGSGPSVYGIFEKQIDIEFLEEKGSVYTGIL